MPNAGVDFWSCSLNSAAICGDTVQANGSLGEGVKWEADATAAQWYEVQWQEWWQCGSRCCSRCGWKKRARKFFQSMRSTLQLLALLFYTLSMSECNGRSHTRSLQLSLFFFFLSRMFQCSLFFCFFGNSSNSILSPPVEVRWVCVCESLQWAPTATISFSAKDTKRKERYGQFKTSEEFC